jgi:hypothetical protein
LTGSCRARYLAIVSWEHEWPLTVWPTRGEVESAIEEVCALAKLPAPAVTHARWDHVEDGDGDDDDRQRKGFGVDKTSDVLGAKTIIELRWQVPVEDAIDVVLRLDPAADRESIARCLELPRGEIDWSEAERAGFVTREGNRRSLEADVTERFTRRPNHYCLNIDLVAPDDDEELCARVSIYSNENDNNEAASVLASIAGELATRLERLGALS